MDIKIENQYHIEQQREFLELEQHILKYGQIKTIPIFQNREGINFILDGKKRFKILKKHNIEPKYTIFNSIIDGYKYIYQTEKIGDSSIVTMVKNCIKIVDPFELYKTLIAPLKIFNRQLLTKILTIPIWGKEFETIAFDFNISIKELVQYCNLSEENFITLFNLFKFLSPNGNHRKDIFNYLDQISRRDKISFQNILNLEDIEEILNSNIQNNGKIDKLKIVLQNIRYPKLKIVNKELEKKLEQFKAPPKFRFIFPIDKESETITINSKISNLKDWEKYLEGIENLPKEQIVDIIETLLRRWQ